MPGWRLTSVLAAYPQVGEELDKQVEWRGCGGRFVHITNKFRATKLPLDVGLRLDALVGVRHHGDEQVDQHDDGDDLVDAEYDLQ